jgi:hypothetical protein
MIGRIAKYILNHGPLPTCCALFGGNPQLVQTGRYGTDAQPRHHVSLVDLADHLRLGVDHRVTRCLLVALAFVAVTVGRAT